MDEELKPRPQPREHALGQDLSALSVYELQERIVLLKAEIVRIEAAIAAKQSSRSTADSVFKI